MADSPDNAATPAEGATGEPAEGATGKPAEGATADTGGDAGKGGSAALAAANARAEAAEAKIAEAERAKLGDTERLTLERDEHKTGREKAEAKLLRLEVAVEKGLTAAQAKRLTGNTREEMEADADELLELFSGKAKNGGKDAAPVGGKPRENLRGGGDPTGTVEETDPAKLAAKIPRRF